MSLLTLGRIQDGLWAAAKTTTGTNKQKKKKKKTVSLKESSRTKPGQALKAGVPLFIRWTLGGSTELVCSFVLLGFWAEL